MSDALIQQVVVSNGSTTAFLDINALVEQGLIMGTPSQDKLKIPVSRKLSRDIEQHYELLSHEPQANEALLDEIDRYKRDPSFRKQVNNKVAEMCWDEFSDKNPIARPTPLMTP